MNRWEYLLDEGCFVSGRCDSCPVVCPYNEDQELQVNANVCPPKRCLAIGHHCSDCEFECPLNRSPELRGEDTRPDFLTHEYRFYLLTSDGEEREMGGLYRNKWAAYHLYKGAMRVLSELVVEGDALISIAIIKSPVGLDITEIEAQTLIGAPHLSESTCWWQSINFFHNFFHSLHLLITRNFPQLVGDDWVMH